MKQTHLRAVYTIRDFCEWARLGRTKVYQEIASGALPAIKVGRRTFITVAAADLWLASQRAY